MIFFKCIIAGFAFLAAFLLVIFVIAIVTLIFLNSKKDGEISVGWDIVPVATSYSGQIVILLVFIAGFIWEYRRAAGH